MGKKFMKKMLVLIAVLCMTAGMSLSVSATEDTSSQDSGEDTAINATTEDPADGVLQVWLTYEDDNGNQTLLSGGSCFLINEEYVLSNHHIFNLNYEEGGSTLRQKAMELLGLNELKDDDPHLKIKVYANRDMSVTATIHDSVQSETLDYVALKLSDKIYDRKALVLGSSSDVKQTDTVYAYGFPEDSISDKQFNTKTDVSATNGSISKVTVSQPADMFEHTAQLNHGNSGGPLMNDAREVVGINTYAVGNDVGSKYYATQIDVIKSGLDTFGIAYVDGDGTVPDDISGETSEGEETEPAEPDPELVSELQSEISKAKDVDTEGYTEESVQVLNDTIGNAESVANNTEATNAEIQGAIDDLKAAVNGLEEESGPSLFLIIGIAAAVLIIIVIIIIIIAVNSSKKKKAKAAVNGPGPIPSVPQGAQVPPVQQPQNQTMSQAPIQNPEMDGSAGTTLLDSGSADTTLLSGAGSGAYLIRKKNGEKVSITSQNFAIGKERRRVDYCISDNTSVSRYHAVITKKGSDYYITDQKSSNFTYVNGVQVSPYQETLLTDRSTVKLSDEEFEFHVS